MAHLALWQFIVHPWNSLPLNASTAVGFGANILIELAFGELYIMDTIFFLVFYVSVCSYFRSCADDLKSIVSDASDDIARRISMKGKLEQFIELHLHLYTHGQHAIQCAHEFRLRCKCTNRICNLGGLHNGFDSFSDILRERLLVFSILYRRPKVHSNGRKRFNCPTKVDKREISAVRWATFASIIYMSKSALQFWSRFRKFYFCFSCILLQLGFRRLR